jgi:tetratricopeptide (TPR) repeat protein
MKARLLLVVVAVALVTGCAKPPALERGLMLYQQGRYRRALGAFDEAVREQPSAAAYANRGTTRIRLGDTAGAIADFTSALQLTPNDSEILFNRGNARLVAGDPKGAATDFTRAAEVRPDFALAIFNRGIARLRSGDALGARADWSEAMKLAKEPEVRAALVRRAVAVGRVAGAPAPDAGDGRALASRALDRELAGDHTGALADLKSALALEADPERRAALEDLLRMWEEAR